MRVNTDLLARTFKRALVFVDELGDLLLIERAETIDALPAGFMVNENPRNGFLTIKRTTPKK